MRVYQTVVQQQSIPRCQGNMLSEAPQSRWSYSGFQASCHNIVEITTRTAIITEKLKNLCDYFKM
jgi:hypothetical protein